MPLINDGTNWVRTDGDKLANGQEVPTVFYNSLGERPLASVAGKVNFLIATPNYSVKGSGNGVEWTSHGSSDSIADRPSAAALGKGSWQVGSVLYISDGADFIVPGLSPKGTAGQDSVTYGPELLVTTNWTTTDGWTESPNDVFAHTAGTTTLSNSLAAVVGTRYQLLLTITGRTAGSVTVSFGGVSKAAITGDGSMDGSFGPKALTTDGLVITPTTDFNGTISLVSIKEVTVPADSIYKVYDSAGNLVREEYINGGVSNTLIGKNAGKYLTTGKQSTFFGNNAGANTSTGYANSFFGYNSGFNNVDGTRNTYLGYGAGFNNVSGSYNIGIGTDGGARNVADNNIFIGHHSGFGDLGVNITGGSSVYIGGNTATLVTSGLQNNVIGYNSGFNLTTGGSNVFDGFMAGFALSTGSYNTCVGNEAGKAITTFNANCYFGHRAGFLATNNNNTGIGYLSLTIMTTGNKNTAVGDNSGNKITTGAQNTFLGSGSGGHASQLATVSFSTAIGYDSYTTKNHQMVLGGTDITETLLRGFINENSNTVTATDALTTYTAATRNNYLTGTAGASFAVTLPAATADMDGRKVVIMSTVERVSTTWVSTGATGGFIGLPATLTANVPVMAQYIHASLAWYITL